MEKTGVGPANVGEGDLVNPGAYPISTLSSPGAPACLNRGDVLLKPDNVLKKTTRLTALTWAPGTGSAGPGAVKQQNDYDRSRLTASGTSSHSLVRLATIGTNPQNHWAPGARSAQINDTTATAARAMMERIFFIFSIFVVELSRYGKKES